jgi:indolepyruvate ferredoxin oxidoreductase
MILDPGIAFPDVDRLVARIAAQTADHVVIDAEAATRAVFGTGVVTNMVTLGAAFQAGVIPLSASAIDGAIDLNGVAVDMNRGAFELGRWLFLDPELRSRFTTPSHPQPDASLSRHLAAIVPDGLPDDVAAVIRHRAADLVAYQNASYARRYLEFVARVRDADRGDSRLTLAVASALHKLMAVKDEYEVARLHRDPRFWADIEQQFGDGAAVSFHLSPPALRRFRGKRKIRLTKSARPMFALLARSKRLRGTALDPFARSAHRKMERALVGEYRTTIETVLTNLAGRPGDARDEVAYGLAVEIAGAAETIRGYETVKERNVERYRARVGELLAELTAH